VDVFFNPINPEAIELIIKALQFNNVLERLQLDDYPDDVKENIELTEKEVNKKRESHGCQVNLWIDFSSKIETLIPRKL